MKRVLKVKRPMEFLCFINKTLLSENPDKYREKMIGTIFALYMYVNYQIRGEKGG